jgi:hypothetical protein
MSETYLEVVNKVNNVIDVAGAKPPEYHGLPARVPLCVGRNPLLVLGGAVLAGGAVTNQVDLSKAAATQLLDHPVVGSQLGQRTVHQLHRGVGGGCRIQETVAATLMAFPTHTWKAEAQ